MSNECLTASSHVYAPCRQRNGLPSSSRLEETKFTSKLSTLTDPPIAFSKRGEIMRIHSMRKHENARHAPRVKGRDRHANNDCFLNLHPFQNSVKLGMLLTARAHHRYMPQ